MVRKGLITVLMAVCLIFPMGIQATAAEPYDGTISTTYITIFRDVAAKISPFDDYVFYRSNQYEYTLVSGDLRLDADRITADAVTIYTINTDNSYNSTYSYTVSNGGSFSLDVGDNLVYSNLGNYPDLIERNSYETMALLVGFCVALGMFIIRPLYNFVLRLKYT